MIWPTKNLDNFEEQLASIAGGDKTWEKFCRDFISTIALSSETPIGAIVAMGRAMATYRQEELRREAAQQ